MYCDKCSNYSVCRRAIAYTGEFSRLYDYTVKNSVSFQHNLVCCFAEAQNKTKHVCRLQ